jgi:hypothetical protein
LTSIGKVVESFFKFARTVLFRGPCHGLLQSGSIGSFTGMAR